jgi:hypothetical protein
MIQEKLNLLESLGIKVKSIDLTGFILNNIDWDKSFKTKDCVHIISENDELKTETIFYYSIHEKYVNLTYKIDYFDNEFDCDEIYSYEMRIADFVRLNWDKLNFKTSK